MTGNITRRSLLALVGFAALGITGCATGARIVVDSATVADDAIHDITQVMRYEIGENDGTKYEDALIEAGGELCGGERGLWCVTFLWWCFREAGYADIFCDGEPEAWPERQHDWFRDQGLLIEEFSEDNPPQRGDLYYQLLEPKYRFEGCGNVSHGEYVVGYDADTHTVTCISANPVVEFHEHDLDEDIAADQFRGYARPAYPSA